MSMKILRATDSKDNEVKGEHKMSMSEMSELSRAIVKGYALINELSKNSYESSWQRYNWQQETVRIQARKMNEKNYIIQVWKPEHTPLTKQEKQFLKSTNLPVHFTFWNWYVQSSEVDFQDAKAVCLTLVKFFEQSK